MGPDALLRSWAVSSTPGGEQWGRVKAHGWTKRPGQAADNSVGANRVHWSCVTSMMLALSGVEGILGGDGSSHGSSCRSQPGSPLECCDIDE